ncbi:DUF6875 domain-containing protein [Methylobacter sp.]|uniref:DUF6875 domain-containing protein n=1 Tax=Methylobacter sp. TaxID=2051955 RepID=UPI002FDD7C77
MIQTELLSWKNNNAEELDSIKNWINEFLCNPHPSLGRTGNVCPFTRDAIDKDSIYFSLEKSFYLNQENEIKKITNQIRLFKELKINNESYKVIINAYPYIDKSEYNKIEIIQNELKPVFVQESLMIGQFYPGCKEKGLWNDKFFPLDSPISLLAIRNMAITDIAFLMSDNSFIEKYLQVFEKKGEDFLIKFMERKKSI